MYNFMLILLILYFIFLFLIKPSYVPKRYKWFYKYKYAHRGLFNNENNIPENSLGAFDLATANNYGIELDVNITKDHVLVVFHDDSLKRMTGVDRKINDCTYEELQSLRLLDTSFTIPTFDEVLKVVDGKTPLIIELKSTKEYKILCELTSKRLRYYTGHYVVESFDPFIVKWFKQNNSNIIRGQLSMNYKKSPIPTYQKVLLEYMLLNFLTRPHFVAYRYTDTNNFSYRNLQWFKHTTVGWTIDNKEDYIKRANEFDVIIFEHFRP